MFGILSGQSRVFRQVAQTSSPPGEAVTYKPAILRTRADRDLEEAIDFYLRQAAPRVTLEFIDAMEQALGAIERHPTEQDERR
jgi:hypothetical protein